MPPVEIIDLCDSSDPDMAVLSPVIPKKPAMISELRTKLRESEKARVAMRVERDMFSESCSKLEEELAAAREKLAQLQEGRETPPIMMEQDDSSSETIRLLHHELQRETSLAADNYRKYQISRQKIGKYQKIMETLWASVECAVCFDAMSEPVAYTCGHLVCQRCATVPNCAHCRAPTQAFIKIYAMRDIVSTISSSSAADPQSPKRTPNKSGC